MTFPGYRVAEELPGTNWHRLYRGQREDGLRILLKATRAPAHVPAIESLQREFDIRQAITAPGIAPACDLLRVDGTACLAMEDPGGIPLTELAPRHRGDLRWFFRLAQAMTTVVARLHREEFVLNGLRPGSFLADEQGDAQLVDLTAASRVATGLHAPLAVSLLDALPYLSPEQTGRMNRVADYRTDFYSLGVLFYEMLTGRPPFASNDPLEVIHWHIARTPAAASDVDPAIPAPLSLLVMKLLAKTAEDRYQSAAGLAEDLRRCAEEWASSGAIAPFVLAGHDVADRFVVPQHLYGRETEVRQLLDAFEAACDGPSSLMLVAGYSGIGKTTLIQELYRPIVRQRGSFIAGKFDQVARHTPYGALIQAFRGLVQQLLAESEERLAECRSRLSAALGANGGVLAAVLPEIELILGSQQPPPALGPTETRNRFRLVFQKLLGALGRPDHPLVIFLDDLQWADSATLDLLQPLLTGAEVRHLFLIGAFRDNEVGPAHPLARTVTALEAGGVVLHRITLGPLGAADLVSLVSDTLHCPAPDAEPLARLVLDKTAGNPFFVIQFLQALRHDGLIAFDHGARRWTVRIEAIAAAGITDNVIDLMTRKIQRLSPAARDALTLAACLGNRFDLETLTTVRGREAAATAPEIAESLEEGLIVAADEATFEFLHDRVQQAAYALIPADERRRVHLSAGRLLLERWDRSAAEERIFEVVGHLNIGSGLITDDGERLRLAGLNLAAARRAKASTAHQVALGYLKTGIALLAPDRWQTEYDLMLELHCEAAECEYLCGNFEAAERYYQLVLERARTREDRARVYSMRIVQYENVSRYADAIAAGLEALAMFDVSFPAAADDGPAALEAELASISRLLGERSIDDLASLPRLTDTGTLTVMRILTAVWASAYIAGNEGLTALVPARIVRLSLEHGNAEESAFGYVTHAITVGSGLGDYRSGQAFGELALRVNELLHDPRRRCKTHHMFSCFVNLWRRPLSTCIPHAREAHRSGLETGDFAYASYAIFHESWYALLTCRHLADFVRDYSPSASFLRKTRMDSLADVQEVILHWGLALQGHTEAPHSLSDGAFDEGRFLAAYGHEPSAHFFRTFFYVAKLQLCYTFERYDEAALAARHARQAVHALVGTIWPVLLDVWDGLTLAAIAGDAEGTERDRCRDELRRCRDSLAVFADNSPENFRCYWLLLAAESERLGSRPIDAVERYEEAIRYARSIGSVQNEALATELLGRFWRQRSNDAIAAIYLQQACRRYADWGAAAKARDIQQRYLPSAARISGEGEASPDTPEDVRASEAARSGSLLDVSTIAKAAHAIAVEIVLEDLLRKLLTITLENAGARRGVFLQEKDGRLLVEADGAVDRAETAVLQSLPIEQAALARSVAQYVWKTGENVVIGHAGQDDRFAADPYLASPRPLSILCVPVVYQGKRAGILYLENDLTTNAFTSERIEVVSILSSQAAIALENARLYDDMKQEVGRRRQAEDSLRKALDEVETLKNRFERENVYLQEEIRREHNFEEMVGSSPALLNLLSRVERVAPTDTTVLIRGETGTGKELIARAVHSRSARKNHPLVKVNCGAIAAGLVESELFGHVKGAFTGALERRVGRFELADRGTIFLDEVGELPPDTQVKLLRVLQEQEFEPVGSSRTVRVDVRVIAATNRDLEAGVRAGTFRSDLFYRLNVLPLDVPPLRERRSDIPQLAQFLVSRFARRFGKKISGLSDESLRRLADYSWPGNIRELQNLIERAVVLSTGPTLDLEAELFGAPEASGTVVAGGLPADQGPASPPVQPALADLKTLEELERQHIETALKQAGGRIEGARGAARVLGLHPNTLRSRMKKLGVTR